MPAVLWCSVVHPQTSAEPADNLPIRLQRLWVGVSRYLTTLKLFDSFLPLFHIFHETLVIRSDISDYLAHLCQLRFIELVFGDDSDVIRNFHGSLLYIPFRLTLVWHHDILALRCRSKLIVNRCQD